MEDVYYALNPWWENKTFDTGIEREAYLKGLQVPFKRKQIEVMVGSRRIGKTTFLKQLIKKCLGKNIPARTILYLALDHPRLSKTSLLEHLRLFRKIFLHSRGQKLYLFFDEVQENPHWETELKSIYDLEDVKILCTGSTSSLIQKQGGKLTGRQIVTTLYPLSFREFLEFKRTIPSQAEDYQYERLFEEYLACGGYPENVLNPSPEYLNNLLDGIIARDIMRLYDIKRTSLLKDLLILLASSVGTRVSFNKLSKTLGLALDTVKDYIEYLESAFLVKPMEKWATSYKDKIYAQKKIYLYDTGIKTLLTGQGDLGVKVENALLVDLLKKGISCGYYAESEREMDFVYGGVDSPCGIEAKYDVHFDWQDRRYSGVKLFLKKYPQTKRILIISKRAEKEFREGKTKIRVIPAWKHFLK